MSKAASPSPKFRACQCSKARCPTYESCLELIRWWKEHDDTYRPREGDTLNNHPEKVLEDAGPAPHCYGVGRCGYMHDFAISMYNSVSWNGRHLLHESGWT
jgi:hypothetical protein